MYSFPLIFPHACFSGWGGVLCRKFVNQMLIVNSHLLITS